MASPSFLTSPRSSRGLYRSHYDVSVNERNSSQDDIAVEEREAVDYRSQQQRVAFVVDNIHLSSNDHDDDQSLLHLFLASITNQRCLYDEESEDTEMKAEA